MNMHISRIVLPLLGICVLSSMGWSVPFEQRPGQYTLSLNEPWKFHLTDSSQEKLLDSFYKPDFDDSGWNDIVVPSNWEVQGFEEPHYFSPDASKVGLYRKTVTVSEEWAGRQVLVHLEGVSFGYTLYLNGKEIGSFEHAFLPCQFDLTQRIQYDKPNVLALKVYRGFDELEFDCNDAWALSGIYRDAFLFSPAQHHFDEYTIDTTLDVEKQSAVIDGTVEIRVFGGKTKDSQRKQFQSLSLHLQLRDMEGQLVADQTEAINWLSPRLVPSHTFSIPVDKAIFWNAEHPYLYDLTMTLMVAGQASHTVNQKVGLRQVSIEQGVLKINGQPVKLRGVCRHEIHPEVGRALREKHWLEDIKLMKAANINTVRCSHYPPHSRFLDLCDQFGLYVLDEVPIGFGERHQNNPAMLGAMLSRAQLTVVRDRNHPSVIIWDIGNENPLLKPQEIAARYVKRMDPSRPILYPGENFNGGVRELATGHADSVDILAPHYPSNDAVRRDVDDAALQIPIIYTEINHSLDVAFGDYAEKWEMIESSDKMAGAMIWLWADQGLKRKIDAREVIDSYADPYALKSNSALSGDVYVDDNTILDSHGFYGSDGIVYADRKPQTDYYETKKIYSPVVIQHSEMALTADGMIHVTIDNRYDFTNLNQISGQWKFLVNGKPFKEGKLALECKPHQSQTVPLQIGLLKIAPSDMMLQLSFTDYNGVDIYERTLVFKDGGVDWNAKLQKGARSVGMLDKDAESWLFGNCRVGFNELGLLAVYDDEGAAVLSGPVARLGRTATMAERKMYKQMKLSFWEPPLLRDIKVLKKDISLREDAVVIEMQVQYPNPKNEKQSAVAALTYIVNPAGWIDVQYELKPDSPEGMLLELGMAWDIPQAASITWLGDGPWPAYPYKDQLVERGIYQTTLKDPFFDGNRTNVELVHLSNASGQNLVVISEPADIGWQSGKAAGQTILYRNNEIASFGTKFRSPRKLIKADNVGTVGGTIRFVLPSEAQGKLLQEIFDQE